MEKSKRVGRSLVIRKEVVRTLSEESLAAIAGGRMPQTTDASVVHCTGGGSCNVCHTTVSVTG